MKLCNFIWFLWKYKEIKISLKEIFHNIRACFFYDYAECLRQCVWKSKGKIDRKKLGNGIICWVGNQSASITEIPVIKVARSAHERGGANAIKLAIKSASEPFESQTSVPSGTAYSHCVYRRRSISLHRGCAGSLFSALSRTHAAKEDNYYTEGGECVCVWVAQEKERVTSEESVMLLVSTATQT